MDTSCKRFIKFGFIISVTCAVLFTVSVYFNNLNFTFKQQSYNVFNISANDNEKNPQSFENNAVRKDDNLGTAKRLKDKVYGAQNVYTTKTGKYSVQDNNKTELVHKSLPSVLEDTLITEYSRKRNDSEDPSQLIKVYGYTFRGGNSVIILLPPFLKGICTKRKEFAPRGSKFFSFSVDPTFQKRLNLSFWCLGKAVAFPGNFAYSFGVQGTGNQLCQTC